MEYKNQKKPKNPSERMLYDQLTQEGWFVDKKGWPDFACFRGGEFIIIEVKPKRSHRLKKAQYRTMLALAQRGIKCYRWSPDIGFELIITATEHV